MWKSETVPELEWYDEPRDNLIDFLEKIPKGLLHSDILVKPDLAQDARYRFVKEHNENVREAIHSTGITAQQWIDKTNRLDEFIEWCKVNATEQDLERALHAKKKYAAGMSIWDGSVHVHVDVFNAYVGRNAIHSLHPTEERSLTLREGMALMGMPNEYDMGGMKNHSKLPQNVPTCTAKSVTEQVIKYLNGELKSTEFKAIKQDNENQIILDYYTDKVIGKSKVSDQPTLEEYFT
jgi:hypothetical protein